MAKSTIHGWMIGQLQRITADVHRHFKQHRFDHLASTLHDAVWHTFCDSTLNFVNPCCEMTPKGHHPLPPAPCA